MIGYYFRDSSDYSFYYTCCHNFSLCVIWNTATLLTFSNPIKLACSQPPNCIGCILLFTCDNENNKLKHPFPLREWRNLQYSHFPTPAKELSKSFFQECFRTEEKTNIWVLVINYEVWKTEDASENSKNSFSKWLFPLLQSFHGTCS